MMTLAGNKKLEHHKRKRDMDDAMQYSNYGGTASGYGGGGGGPHGGSSNVISREEKKTNDTMKHYHSDDEDGPLEGHLTVAVGDVLGNRFTVQKLAGEGTFGKVYRCRDAKHSDEVAIKVIRKIDRYISSAKIEAKILKQLYYMQEHSEWQPNVIMYTHFYHLGHYCMVFEPLGKSLLDYVESNKYQGFPKHMVKEVAYQLLSALEFLHRNSMVHTDLKLENILFEEGPESDYSHAPRAFPLPSSDIRGGGGAGKTPQQQQQQQQPLCLPTRPKIKLIDFGGATYEHMHKSKIINTRQYRSPEVILELGWSYPSDVWSAACVVAEIASGDLLFSTHDDLEHLGLIERMVESVPELMRARSPIGAEFFDNGGRESRGSSKRGGYSNTSSSGSINIGKDGTFGWSRSSSSSTKIKAGQPYGKSAMPLRAFDLCRTSFDYVKQAHTLAYFTDPQDRGHGDDLADLMWGMLRVDPALRAQPRECLKHSYFDDIVEDL